MLIEALALGTAGATLLRAGLTQCRRRGVFTVAFWRTFRPYAGYRARSLAPLAWSGAGAGLVLAGAALLYQWVKAYYAARLGHPPP